MGLNEPEELAAPWVPAVPEAAAERSAWWVSPERGAAGERMIQSVSPELEEGGEARVGRGLCSWWLSYAKMLSRAAPEGLFRAEVKIGPGTPGVTAEASHEKPADGEPSSKPRSSPPAFADPLPAICSMVNGIDSINFRAAKKILRAGFRISGDPGFDTLLVPTA